LSRPIVHIDGAVWYIAVGSSYPGGAQATKGVGVHALKGIVSWVKNVNNKANDTDQIANYQKRGVAHERSCEKLNRLISVKPYHPKDVG
jgi:hypothetical protein